MNENIKSNTILEDNDDGGEINLLINKQYSVIMAEPAPHIINNPHSMILVLCDTSVIDYQ